jgi:hypothetical protein
MVFSASKNSQRIPVNTSPAFRGLWPCICQAPLHLVTKTVSDMLLARIIHEDFYCNRRCLTHTDCRETRVPSTLPDDQFVQKHPAQTAKSVQQMYSHSMYIPHWNIEQGCNCPYTNTVTARHLTAFRLRRRYLVKDPQRADFRNVLAQNVLCPYILLRP